MVMNPWNNFSQNEHAKLIENYQNVSLQVKYLRDIINNLEEKIHELENEKEAKNSKVYKRCKFFNTGFFKNCENCCFQHPVNMCGQEVK